MQERVISRRHFLEGSLKTAVLASAVLLTGMTPDSPREGPMTLSKAVGSDGLDLTRWELDNAPSRLVQIIWERTQANQSRQQQVRLVQRYFSSDPRPVALERDVEKIMAGQIQEAFEEGGIYSPVPGALKFVPPPKAIAISSRDNIAVIAQMPLRFRITLQEIEALENKVESLLQGVSALVFNCGGWSTWPASVVRGLPLPFTFEISAHEITHAKLAPTPLGRPFTASQVGFPRNNEIATMNETLANMMGQEIGRAVADRYYREDQPRIKEVAYIEIPKGPTLDRNRVLRETRISVDRYLKQGWTEEAERLMEKTRQKLRLRKLNQAYFAVFGTYADGPSSIDPIGELLRKLRRRHSLGDFYRIVSNITSSAQLQKAV